MVSFVSGVDCLKTWSLWCANNRMEKGTFNGGWMDIEMHPGAPSMGPKLLKKLSPSSQVPSFITLQGSLLYVSSPDPNRIIST